MKKITKAVFSFGRQSPVAIVLTSMKPMLACTENGCSSFTFSMTEKFIRGIKI